MAALGCSHPVSQQAYRFIVLTSCISRTQLRTAYLWSLRSFTTNRRCVVGPLCKALNAARAFAQKVGPLFSKGWARVALGGIVPGQGSVSGSELCSGFERRGTLPLTSSDRWATIALQAFVGRGWLNWCKFGFQAHVISAFGGPQEAASEWLQNGTRLGQRRKIKFGVHF